MTDDALLGDLRRLYAAADPVPPALVESVKTLLEDREELDCSAYPEGSSRHDYRRITARPGETAWKCRGCGDVFVALDSEVRALDEGDWDG